MENATLNAYCLALGISDQQLADLFNVNKRTVRRWRTKADIPQGVAQEVQQIWENTIKQVRENLFNSAHTITEDEQGAKVNALTMLVKEAYAAIPSSTAITPFAFADTLDARRLALGLSVKDFAELVGVSVPTASRWLNGAVSGKGPYLMEEAEARLREAEDWVEKQTLAEGDSLADDAERWPVGMRKVACARRAAYARNRLSNK